METQELIDDPHMCEPEDDTLFCTSCHKQPELIYHGLDSDSIGWLCSFCQHYNTIHPVADQKLCYLP